jgi:D-alanyl-D-alanine carboxypeptidase
MIPEKRRSSVMYGYGPGRYSKLFLTAVLAAVLVAAAFIISSCGTPSFSSEVSQKIEQAIREVMEELDIPGAVAGVWVPDMGELTLAIGEADIEDGRTIQTADRFRIGSITKTFTATAILQLVDEGLLSLDDTVDKYVAGIPDGDKITVRQLCNHTSGLYNYGEDENLVIALDEDPHKVWTPRELVDVAISHEPYFPPGEGWYYSNTGYILMGMIIEEVTGSSYEAVIKDRIIEPLGLSNTSVAESPEMAGQYSRGYEQKEEGSRELVDRTDYLDPSIVWAAGAMISNLEDLKVWAKALAEGELLSDASHKEQMDWVDLPDDPNSKYGLGVLYVYGLEGHDGRQPGYDAAVFYYPPRQATFVVLFNKAEQSSVALGVALKLANIVLPEDISF